MTDPILLDALRQLVSAQQNAAQSGETLRPQDMDAFLREETKGKYGLNDLAGLNARNLGRSMVQGLTFNFGDELLGKLPKMLGGGADAEEEMRLREKLFHSQHPLADDVGQVAGTLPYLLVPGGGEEAVGGAVARGALTGAAAGALTGAGSGEDTGSRLTGAAVGGVGGAALGALIPSAVALTKYLKSPEIRASSRIAHAIEKSGGVSALQGKLAQNVAAGRGDETMLGDLSDRLRQEMDFAANNSDDVLVPLAEKVRARQQGSSERLLNDVRSQVGDPQADQIQKALEAGRSAWAAGPQGYGGLRDAKASFDMSDLASRLGKPTVSEAWRQAQLAGDITEDSPLDQLMQKLSRANPKLRPEAVQSAATSLARSQNAAAKMAKQVIPFPTLDQPRAVNFDDLQAFKRALDGKVTQAYRGGNGTLAEAYKTVRGEVTGVMNDALPQAQGVNAEYGRRIALEDALQAGQEAFHEQDTRGLAKQVAQLAKDPQQLTLFRKGMASELIAQLRSAKTNRSLATELLNRAPSMDDKLLRVFGNQQVFDTFVQNASVEAELAKMRGPISGSQTARRLQAAGFDPAELGVAMASHGVSGLIGSTRHAILSTARHAIERNTAQKVGTDLMTQGAPEIEKFLQSLSQRQPILGRTASHTAPLLAPRITGSLWDLLQQ